jgi:acyl carrier protein
LTESGVYERLTELFHDVFFRDDIVLKPELTAADVTGWDSLKQVEIILCVEERFDVKLTTKEVDSLRKVGDLASLIMKKAV